MSARAPARIPIETIAASLCDDPLFRSAVATAFASATADFAEKRALGALQGGHPEIDDGDLACAVQFAASSWAAEAFIALGKVSR